MKRLLFFLLLPLAALGQTLPWTGNSTKAWLQQSPNALSIPKAGTYISLSGQTNRLSVAAGSLLLDGSPIGGGGNTIYTGNGSQTGNRTVTGAGHSLDFTGQNNIGLTASTSITIAAPNVNLSGGSFTTINGSGASPVHFPAAPATPSATDEIMARDPVTGNFTFGPAYTVGVQSGGQTNWGILVKDPVSGSPKNTGVTIADIINGGGPGGTNQNFANTDLTFTGTRIHNADQNSFDLNNATHIGLIANNNDFSSYTVFAVDPTSLNATMTSDGNFSVTIGNTTISSYNDAVTLSALDTAEVQLATPATHNSTAVNGQVFTLTDQNSGAGEWADAPVGPNFANANLTLSTNRTHNFNHKNMVWSNVHNWTPRTESTISLETISDSTYLQITDEGGGIFLVIPDYEGGPLLYINTPSVGGGRATVGQVLTLQDASQGVAEWADAPFPLNGVPTVSAGSGSGTSPTVSLANETDSAFTLNVTAGTTPSVSANIAVVTFASTYVTPPHFSLSPANRATATLSGASQVWATTTTTNLTLHSNLTGLVATTNYVWEVIAVR